MLSEITRHRINTTKYYFYEESKIVILIEAVCIMVVAGPGGGGWQTRKCKSNGTKFWLCENKS